MPLPGRPPTHSPLPLFPPSPFSAPHARGTKECACGCAGVFSAHAALPLYAMAFDQAGKLPALEGFASLHGAAFYRRKPNTGCATLARPDPCRAPLRPLLRLCAPRRRPGGCGASAPLFPAAARSTVTLARSPFAVPDEYRFGDATVVPFMAGGSVPWTVTSVQPQ